MLPRILIIMALVGIGLFLLKKALGTRKPPPSQSQQPDGKLVVCAHCAARLPATEALWKEGQAFCSMTHRNLGPRKGD
jgi:hypothetical protein